MSTIKNNLKNLFLFMLIYILLLGSFSIFTAGVSYRHYMLDARRFIPMAFAVTVTIIFWNKLQINKIKLLPHLLVALSWFIVYPFCYWYTYHNSNVGIFGIQFPYDAAFAVYFFTASIFLRLLFLQYLPQKVQAFIIGLIHTLFIIPPLIQTIYYSIYKTPITSTAALAILQTNPRETQEYILQTFGYLGILSSIVLLIVIFYTFYILNTIHDYKIKSLQTKKTIAFAAIVSIGLFAYCGQLFYATGLGEAFKFAHEHLASAKQFNSNHTKLLAGFTSEKPAITFSKPSTIIIVIGESASRDYLSAFHNLDKDTTPWLRSMKTSPNFLLFNHAYTSKAQTVPSLERALTEKNQYNKIPFNNSLTIIDLAKAAGYKTYWFSGQGSVTDADTPITIVAKTADKAVWLEEISAHQSSQYYDTDLIPILKTVNPNENNFIVMHFMGSHDNTFNRYPDSFDRFANHDHKDRLNCYLNSIAYSDYALQQIYEYASISLNLQAMMYFSDHGGGPAPRHPDEAAFNALRIPFFTYVSPEYQSLYPDTYVTMKNNQNQFFSNDLIYETVGTLLQIKSNHLQEENSLFSAKYKFNKETLLTNEGKNKLSEDKGA